LEKKINRKSITRTLSSSDGCEFEVSAPFNVHHDIHVDFNSETGFSGLPDEWKALLQSSSITKMEVITHSDVVLDVLKFHDLNLKKQGISDQLPTDTKNNGSSQPKPLPHVPNVAKEKLGPISQEKELERQKQRDIDTTLAQTKQMAENQVIPLPEAVEYSLDSLVNSGDPTQIYPELTKIGEGGAGSVYSALHKTGKKVAIKKMELNANNTKVMVQEISLMKDSASPNIVAYLEAYKYKRELWVVMEFMGGGCLTELLEHHDAISLQESHIAYVCKNTLQGLAFIHSKHRIHRDIKSDNILLGNNGEVKIADFGYAAQLTKKATKETKCCRNSLLDGSRSHSWASLWYKS